MSSGNAGAAACAVTDAIAPLSTMPVTARPAAAVRFPLLARRANSAMTTSPLGQYASRRALSGRQR